MKKIVHGPLQEDPFRQYKDHTGKYVIPRNRKKILIKKIRDPDGNIKEIYYTDKRVPIVLVRDDFSQDQDVENMLELIGNTGSTEERNTVFIENLYKIDGICKYQKVDQNF